MTILSGKKILLGVCSGIAAYKSVELVRLLRKSGAQVQVVMTFSAKQFVAPLTFQSVSGRPVAMTLFSEKMVAMEHIDLARWADMIVVAPATANAIAKLAHGMADDLLSTLCLAAECPVAIAPAMNQAMWHHAATAHNVALLRERNVLVWGPGEGEQACGEFGLGRMLEPGELLTACEDAFSEKTLLGKKVVITAGPTREAFDPVRFISNRSSGKMGFALAESARQRGAEVVLISGPVSLASPQGVTCIRVESAEAMHAAVQAHLSETDIFIASAAVADYRPADTHNHKLKRKKEPCQWDLVPTLDILKEVVESGKARYTIGFAAETESLEANALKKLNNKQCDLLVANLVGLSNRGFDADQNKVVLYWQGGDQALPLMSKVDLADRIFDVVERRYFKKWS